MSIEDNIRIRKVAEQLHDLMQSELRSDAEVQACLNVLSSVPPRVAVEPIPPPIARLGSTVLGFGRYRGSSYDDVPLEYLDWLCREQENMLRDLRAYLKHPQLTNHRPANWL